MPNPSNFKDLTGQTFGNLYVVKRIENTATNKAQWQCECLCGNIIPVITSHLKSGHTKSCGCLKRDLCIERHLTHGMSDTPEYNIWLRIIQRCTNPNNQDFKDYGGRGITICDKWRYDFMAFFNHTGKRPSIKHSIDRINNNSGYKPNNVQWSLPQKQANNKRNNHNIIIHYCTMTMSQWAKFVGMDNATLWNRIKNNWPIEKAVFQPVRHHKTYSKRS